MSRLDQSIPERLSRTTSAPGPVRRSMEVCREITRKRAASFYRAIRLTPEKRRGEMYALYAWSRLADDIADDSPDAGAARSGLDRFAKFTKEAFANCPAGDDTTIWPAVTWTFRTCAIRPRWSEDLIEGMRREVGESGGDFAIESIEQFEDYCYRVAGTVGLMCISVWGLKKGVNFDDIVPLSKARGRALQTINVLRDFASDFDRSPKRVYFPADVLGKCGLIADGLRQWRDPVRCEAAVRELTGFARRSLNESAPLADKVDPSCFAVLDGLTRVYSALLDRIEKKPKLVIAARPVHLSLPMKSWIAASSYARGWSRQLSAAAEARKSSIENAVRAKAAKK
ncbi:MAG: squalene/phytoene synthase family protein [Phycisphaeraceae bacterium]|nr:squalene/phytoene synthase family protein [Phycisphaeraceae bacterium]